MTPLRCTQAAKVEYFSPTRCANCGPDSLPRANSASRRRRCFLETRTRRVVNVREVAHRIVLVTGVAFGNSPAGL
jgi:hypothetical protein